MAEQEMISSEELKDILTRYAIGKKPLAALLGWGATTVMRYADGLNPAGEYGTHLKKLYDEPLYYLELLEANKDRITPVAYKKSKNAVLEYLTMSKLWCGVQYIIERAEADVSPYRVVMSLYYAQAFSLGLTDKALFWEECELSTNNVPYAALYEQLRRNGISNRFSAENLFTPEEEKFLDAAYRMLLWYGPAELAQVFSAERKYLRISRMEGGGRKLKNAAIGGYFKKVVQGYKITSPEEFNLYFAERTGRAKKR